MAFLEVISGISSAASISGFSLKDLVHFVNDPDKKKLEQYFSFLEARQVLVAPFNQEVTQAVVKSLESIKTETEQCRLSLQSEMAQYFLLELITTLSKELMVLHKYQNSNNDFLFYNAYSPSPDHLFRVTRSHLFRCPINGIFRCPISHLP